MPKNVQSVNLDKNKTLKAWVNDYGDDLFRRALYLTSHQETAEYLVQETFLAAAQHLDRFAGRSSPRT